MAKHTAEHTAEIARKIDQKFELAGYLGLQWTPTTNDDSKLKSRGTNSPVSAPVPRVRKRPWSTASKSTTLTTRPATSEELKLDPEGVDICQGRKAQERGEKRWRRYKRRGLSTWTCLLPGLARITSGTGSQRMRRGDIKDAGCLRKPGCSQA